MLATGTDSYALRSDFLDDGDGIVAALPRHSHRGAPRADPPDVRKSRGLPGGYPGAGTGERPQDGATVHGDREGARIGRLTTPIVARQESTTKRERKLTSMAGITASE